jgi:hypothetical protein
MDSNPRYGEAAQRFSRPCRHGLELAYDPGTRSAEALALLATIAATTDAEKTSTAP